MRKVILSCEGQLSGTKLPVIYSINFNNYKNSITIKPIMLRLYINIST
jgi:hypothetical protein